MLALMASLRGALARIRRAMTAPKTTTAPSGTAQWVKPSHIEFDYRPKADGKPDPGEIVWAWVPFEEGDGRGKDRPVLIIAHQGAALLGLMLTSKDHDRDAAREAHFGRYWFDIGSGSWDRQGRPSEVRLDRVLRLPPDTVRREGSALDRATFLQVAAAVRKVHG
jgi:hypothetical protein